MMVDTTPPPSSRSAAAQLPCGDEGTAARHSLTRHYLSLTGALRSAKGSVRACDSHDIFTATDDSTIHFLFHEYQPLAAGGPNVGVAPSYWMARDCDFPDVSSAIIHLPLLFGVQYRNLLLVPVPLV